MYYLCIHNYSMEGYTPIFISSFMWFSLFSSLYFFLCMLVRVLSSKIYFLCFFLASLLIALVYYFYMVSKLQGAQPFHLLHGIRATWSTTLPSSTKYQIRKVDQVLQSWGAHPVFYPSLKKSLSSLQDFLLILFCRLHRASPRAYRQLQYGFKSSYTISFQLCWLESQDEHILEEATSLWSLHRCIEWTWVLWREDWLVE